MIDPPAAEHSVIHRDPLAYCAHPQIARAGNGDWLVVFNRTRRRRFIFHPPHDPLYRNMLMRSSDGGAGWSAPQVVPGYEWQGTECASLTVLRSGRVLLNQWRNRWYPLDLARRLEGTTELWFPRQFVAELIESAELDTGADIAVDSATLAPWARGRGESYVHLSDDHGRSFTRTFKVATAPYSGGYGMRGAVELPSGEVLLPLNDIPEFRTIFIVRSADGGENWGAPTLVCAEPGRLFTEPSLVRLASGRLLLMMREDAGRMMQQCASDDDGATWSAPAVTFIDGYPPHLLALPDGRLLCTYGHRRPEYGIRAALSSDGGTTWDVERAIRIHRLPNRDLGYPCTLLDRDGRLFTVYYGQDGEGVTGIHGTQWRLP